MTVLYRDQKALDSAMNPFTPKFNQKFILPTLKGKYILGKAVRIYSMIMFHLSKLWKAKFILCDVIFLVRLQGKFEINTLEWKG